MADKPQITATIKFRGVTIEGMSIEELQELRDLLNTLVGKEKEYVPYPVYPNPIYPNWTCFTTSSTSKITLGGNTTSGQLNLSDNVNYAISLN